ncbi:MAG: type IV toxin-antitoxin system AbiEi family antitoxin domain-containing protein, partial [Actinomycetota bacterium]|nr:type IV toxin-antitoxin system AbiEi family antitoxin domain-containing protein [Actinomycetota bacterium]
MRDVVDFLPGIRELDRPRPRDVLLAKLAEDQFGIVTSAQLVNLGFSSSAISRMVGSGRLIRLHRGVYAVGHSRLVARGRWLAAVLACGDEAVLSHREGAALLDLRYSERSRVDVTVAGRSRSGQK